MIIFLSGSGVFGVQAAEALLEEGHEVVGVASPALRKGHSDDSQPLSWDRLRSWSFPRRIPWTAAPDLRASHVPDGVDIIVAAHSHAFIGRATRARAGVASIGYHPSLLPLHRGRDAIRWTIRDRDRVTGGTVYHLTERTDGGPIAAQEHLLVPPGATAESLWREELAPLGIHLLVRVVNELAKGYRVEVEQDEDMATWEPSMDAAPLFKPELPALGGTVATEGHQWALLRR